ncbi:MAG: WYL domain-containing protein [Cypionkella sp.]
MQVTYQSMSRPEPSARWIEPHALAFDGFRWHARAFCQNDQVFKDFLLSRIVEIGKQGPVTADPQSDADWHNGVGARNRAASRTVADAAPRDRDGLWDGRRAGARSRYDRALLFYALKRLGLDTDPAARRPQDQQIVLLNGNDIFGTSDSVKEK